MKLKLVKLKLIKQKLIELDLIALIGISKMPISPTRVRDRPYAATLLSARHQWTLH